MLYLSSYQQYRWRCCSQNSFCFRHTCLQFNLVLGNLWLSIPLLQAWKYYYEFLAHQAVVAEWLRRLTRNQFPSGSVGSNPTDCDKDILVAFRSRMTFAQKQISRQELHPSSSQHRWFSGRMLACHAGGPGSIPGRCNIFFSSAALH